MILHFVRKSIRAARLASCGFALFVPAIAVSQEAQAPGGGEQVVEEVVITGSRIEKPDVGETFYPVSAVGRFFYLGATFASFGPRR
jgi:hypothetical protein